jgi:phenylacetate-CoA ligase
VSCSGFSITAESNLHADLRNRHYCAWLEFLRKSESWNRSRIEQFQLSEIKRVVDYAYRNTAGYRRLYDEYGVNPSNIRTLDDFRRFPFVEKELIRDHLEDFSTGRKRGRQYVTTAGSTGIPFGFYRDNVAFAKELASKAYQYYRIGWKEGARQLVFRGLPINSRSHVRFYPRFNELRCSSYHLTGKQMEAYRKRALEYKPEFVKCYPSSGYIFARFLKDTGRSFPPVRGVLCASENLYDYQKQLLLSVFGARVFSHYGHYELAVLAGFCEYEDTYHVLPQYGFAELLDKEGRPVETPGQIGEIVATSFIMNITPFINYRTRDLAVFKANKCDSCGRPYQIWQSIGGRLQEFIVTASGRYISMTAINMHDDVFDHISQFQFYQEQKGKVEFRYIPKQTLNDVILQDVKDKLLFKLGSDVELTARAVSDIPPANRGKHRFLIQKLKIEYGDI